MIQGFTYCNEYIVDFFEKSVHISSCDVRTNYCDVILGKLQHYIWSIQSILRESEYTTVTSTLSRDI